jgi:predicted MPP superfamily phosphohydrolase
LGLDELAPRTLSSHDATLRIILTHYPLQVDMLAGSSSSLVLAGHSHGGQVNFPIIGPLHLPPGVGRYVQGMFPTRIGPLHVSAGLGTSEMKIRMNCRPEITVIDA